VRVGIYGGTFNPPHIGHVRSAEEAAQQLMLDLLVIVPVGVPPHKPLPHGSPCADIRLFMTHTAFNNIRNTIVSNIEVNNPEPSYTVDTIGVLRKIYPDSELFLLLGTDMYMALESWKDVGTLLGMVTPAVFSRSTSDARQILKQSELLKKCYGADTSIVTNSVIPISSSDLREMLPNRGGVGYIKDTNYSYIIKNRLYGAKPDWNWLRERAYSMLDPKRIQHVTACETAAMSLAERWGVDPDDAREAAILHDITKKLGLDLHLRVLEDHDVPVGTLQVAGEKLLHAKTGAVLAKAVFGVPDAVSDAIAWHTTGRAGMSRLEKVIYMADYIESTRDFPEVKGLRRLAYENLDAATIKGLEMTIADIQARGIAPDASSVEALDDIRKAVRGMRRSAN